MTATLLCAGFGLGGNKRPYEYAHEFIGFVDEQTNDIVSHDAGAFDQREPLKRFAKLLENGVHLVDKIGSALSAPLDS